MSIDVIKPELSKYGTERQNEYLDAVLKYGSATKAADKLGVNRRTVDRAISALKRAAIEAGDIGTLGDSPKVLTIDIENMPTRAWIWRMWDMVTNVKMLESDWYLASFSAKWLGDDEPITRSLRSYKGYKPGTENDSLLLADIRNLLCQAEYVIGHNSDKFDIKKINTRMVMGGLNPPTPYRSIDTYKIAKRTFSFTSNKLEFLAQKLLGEGKLPTGGVDLWFDCIAGDPEAWTTMELYNERDTLLTERLYLKLRAWDHLHPNMNLSTSTDDLSCTACTSSNVKPTGDTVAVGTAGLYLGYVCGDCGHQMRGRTNIRTLSQKHAGLVNAR